MVYFIEELFQIKVYHKGFTFCNIPCRLFKRLMGTLPMAEAVAVF